MFWKLWELEAQMGKVLARRCQQNQMLAVIAVLSLVVIQWFSKLFSEISIAFPWLIKLIK